MKNAMQLLLRAQLLGASRPNITAAATEVNEADLERFVLPQLVNEYKNDQEGFIGQLPGVPAGAVGKEGIYKNRLVTQPDALINNDNPFASPGTLDRRHLFVPWDTVDTTRTKARRSEVRGMTYDVNNELRNRHMTALKRKTRDYLLWKLAPEQHSADTPVIVMSGGAKYAELVKLRTLIVNRNVEMANIMLILDTSHTEDLGLEQGGGDRFRQVMYDEVQGKPKGFAGFMKLFEHNNMPRYDSYTGQKKAFGSVDGVPASLVINIPEVIFHRETIEVYWKPKTQDVESADPGDDFRLGGYFAAEKLVDKGFGALI